MRFFGKKKYTLQILTQKIKDKAQNLKKKNFEEKNTKRKKKQKLIPAKPPCIVHTHPSFALARDIDNGRFGLGMRP